MQTTRLMTADELLAMPDDGSRKYELVNGELIAMSPAGTRHGRISTRLLGSLGAFVDAHRLGEVYPPDTGFVIARNPDTVRAPDVSFVSSERAVDTEKYFPGAPDLAAEVVSPNDTYSEVESKVREYIAAGTRIVIVVDPRTRSAKITTSRGSTTVDETGVLTADDVVPGWSLPMIELFR